MTVIIGCKFKEGAIIIADSRVTWKMQQKEIYSDTAQKVLPLGRKLAIAFAGSVKLASYIVDDIRIRIKKRPHLHNPIKLSHELMRVARFYYQNYLKKTKLTLESSIFFILGGVENNGDVHLWAYEPPDFHPKEIKDGYVLLGSGNIIGSDLNEKVEELYHKNDELKQKADILITELEAKLKSRGVDTVGGLFQPILLSSLGILPMTYGFININPESQNAAKEIVLSKGTWTQRDLYKKSEVKLKEPKAILNSLPIENRFHNLEPPNINKDSLKWYLNYFIICLKVEKQVQITKFVGILSQVGSFRYPREFNVLASLGFWGPCGNYKIKIYLDDGQSKQSLFENMLHIPFPTEQQEFDIPLKFTIERPGPVFIECYISEYLIARRALYFGELQVNPPKNMEEFNIVKNKISQDLISAHRECIDPELKKRACFLDYFIICQNLVRTEGIYEFQNEIKAIYWKNYPLLYKFFITSGFRFAKGKHTVRIDFINAISRETSVITTDIIEGSSECLVTPIEGELVVTIQESSLYYFNLYVDDQFISSILISAEGVKPKYSYSLRDEDAKRVDSGELILLVKRSQQAKP